MTHETLRLGKDDPVIVHRVPRSIADAFRAEARARGLTEAELFHELDALYGNLDEPDDTSPEAVAHLAQCMSEPGLALDELAGRWMFLEMWRRYLVDRQRRAATN